MILSFSFYEEDVSLVIGMNYSGLEAQVFFWDENESDFLVFVF